MIVLALHRANLGAAWEWFGDKSGLVVRTGPWTSPQLLRLGTATGGEHRRWWLCPLGR